MGWSQEDRIASRHHTDEICSGTEEKQVWRWGRFLPCGQQCSQNTGSEESKKLSLHRGARSLAANPETE